jgi:hypothetical protein
VRYCVPLPHRFVQVLQLLQAPGVQSRLHRLRRRLRHESTEERKQVVKSRATKIAATFMLGVSRRCCKWNIRWSNVVYSIKEVLYKSRLRCNTIHQNDQCTRTRVQTLTIRFYLNYQVIPSHGRQWRDWNRRDWNKILNLTNITNELSCVILF